jgi:hypothetical protein
MNSIYMKKNKMDVFIVNFFFIKIGFCIWIKFFMRSFKLCNNKNVLILLENRKIDMENAPLVININI